MIADYLKRAEAWTAPEFDEATRNKVKQMILESSNELEDAFYRNLEFGTGGLRAVMGVGTNRMNLYTVGMATQGLSNYLKANFKDKDEIKVAVSFDCRNNSREFARVTAEVFAANGITVFLFDELRPTPELSYTIRHLGCSAGVMITASHNPKEYNGYKVYWEDGAQITAPHDTNIVNEVAKIAGPSEVRFKGGEERIHIIGKEIDEAYLKDILSLMLSPDAVARHKNIKIVYTPLHGTGVRLVPEALRRVGFENLFFVEAQNVNDGNFPTVKSPNPEEKSALEMAVNRADEVGADLVMATDPDADRLGIAVRDNDGKMQLLNGNQTASILTYYMLTRWKELGKLNSKTYMVKTIVTTELLAKIAESFGVKMYNVLTGFKYIAQVVRENEGKMLFIGGGEESYGFNAGEFVRDKDAVVACSLVAECAAWCCEQGLTLYRLLQRIYDEYGFYKEALVSLTKKGKEGLEEIGEMMRQFRVNPPKELGGSSVVKVIDYQFSLETGLPKSDVLQFFTESGCIVSVRPSGTEPKIKFYFEARGSDAEDKINRIKRSLNL